MCRWLVYFGEPITPYRFLYGEEYSLIEQAHHARKSKTIVNGDGFGFGWYSDGPEPGLFRDILPAWSDSNLLNLARHVRSGLFMAHVRAATDTVVSRPNCHPFTSGRAMFMHNGQVGGYTSLRRHIESLIPDELYHDRLGSTDSEALFLYLESLLADRPFHTAVRKVVEAVEGLMRQAEIIDPFRFTSAYSDGNKVYVVRYASDERAPSLYYCRDHDGWIIVSEPLDGDKGRWRAVPRNHTMVIDHHMPDPLVMPLQHDGSVGSARR